MVKYVHSVMSGKIFFIYGGFLMQQCSNILENSDSNCQTEIKMSELVNVVEYISKQSCISIKEACFVIGCSANDYFAAKDSSGCVHGTVFV